MRHLANVFQGLLMSSPEVVNTPSKWAKLWLHESERVYADRLVSQGVSGRRCGRQPLRCTCELVGQGRMPRPGLLLAPLHV